ncbi:hypothetical protein PVAP13_6KG124235 [Panicum virgatum]|uniref:Uncharacterized protein n=1 Tax=Panicum virgatum TaxID=38727 RepID=A0A8T0RAJ6_PANVG|nr:hypothetical protein PVAP13_6KG124235 [Panicum virgatum]
MAPPFESPTTGHPSPDFLSIQSSTTASAPRTFSSLQAEPSLTALAPCRRMQAAVATMVDFYGDIPSSPTYSVRAKKVVHAAEAAVPTEGRQRRRPVNPPPPAIHRLIP